MQLKISLECPQCGGPVELEETDRLFKCPYCRVRLHITAPGAFRYWLSPKTKATSELLFVPYWRFKGMTVKLKKGTTDLKFIDTTFIGRRLEGLPVSLGVRPQALPLRFVTKELPHFFVEPESFKRVFENIDNRVQDAENLNLNKLSNKPGEMLLRSYVGETKSIIYLPLYIKDSRIIDGITDRAVCDASLLKDTEISKPTDWGLRFIAALCPNCGWDLESEKDSIVLFCRNCHSAWAATEGFLQRVNFTVAVPENQSCTLYLPFWRIKADISPLNLVTYFDLVKFANLPKVPQKGWQEKRFYFWVPAFKVQPEKFLYTSKVATVAQMETIEDPALPRKKIYTVTLPSEEAEEILSTILVEISRPRKRVVDVFQKLTINVTQKDIVLVPFEETTYLYVQPTMNLGLSKGLLRYGRNI